MKVKQSVKYVSLSLSILIIFINISYSVPTELVTVYGDEFNLNGQAYRFVGVNIRGICHYGHGDPLPYTNSSHIDENPSLLTLRVGQTCDHVGVHRFVR